MKTARILLAISALTACHLSQAATVPINVTISATTGQLPFVDLNGSATGTYDIDTGELAFTGGWTSLELEITGTWHKEGLADSGIKTYTSCQQNIVSLINLCEAYPLNTALSWNTAIRDNDGVLMENIQTGANNYTIFYEVKTVPVPTAAWLFGSAIIGLVNIGRKRK